MMSALLDHTSDVAILAKGHDLKSVFSDALSQMNEFLLPGHCSNLQHYDCLVRLQLRGGDSTALLIDFLSETLALTYIQKAIFCHAYFEKLSVESASGFLFGRWYGQLDNEIKAVTYHEANLSRNAEGLWSTPILFDL